MKALDSAAQPIHPMTTATKYTALLFLLSACLLSCQSEAQQKVLNGFRIQKPTVPAEEIRVGNPRRDGIPAIDRAQFITAEEVDFLSPDDPVIGVEINGEAKAYPLKILTWHEIVNDSLGGRAVVITYCPLCRSAYVFDRQVGEQVLDFGVSGLLYNSNVIMYDRQTESLWSQMAEEAIDGQMREARLRQIAAATSTSWQQWLSQHPDTQVLSKNTGYRRNYERSPYGDYAQSRDIMFPMTAASDRFNPKTLVAGIEVNGRFKAYPLPELEKAGENPMQDEFAGKILIVRFDEEARSVRVTDRRSNPIPTNVLYWFAWYAFHPDTEVFSED